MQRLKGERDLWSMNLKGIPGGLADVSFVYRCEDKPPEIFLLKQQWLRLRASETGV